MDRYREYSQNDDPAIQGGDISLLGVNSWDSAENLQPGQVQSAVNMDFTTQDAGTRGGFVCLPALGSNPFGQSWTARTPASASNWRGISYGNSVFVAVGTLDAIMTSLDGVTWTSRTGTSGGDLRAITYGNNLFVAVGDAGAVETSPDGITWTNRVAASANDWSSVAYGNGVYVSVSSNSGTPRAMTSADGITWTLRTAANYGQVAIAYGNGVFVSVGLDGSLGETIQTSSDGIIWTNQVPAGMSGVLRGIAFSGSLFSVVGNTGDVETSPDGVTWTLRSGATTNNWTAIAYGVGGFAAVSNNGSGNRVMTSVNGIGWFSRTTPNSSWAAITSGNGIFVAVGNNAVMTSNTTTLTVFASGIYSDPDDAGSQWIMLVGASLIGFYANGRTARSVNYGAGLMVDEMSTVVQCDNVVYIFRGSGQTPLYWDGNWGSTVTLAATPAPGPGFQIIPNSNQATYYQNRLWVIDGKDDVAASDVLDFTAYDLLANDFNLNTGSSDFLVTTFPFGTTTLVVFKNKSIIALTSVDGALTDVVATEITRQVGSIGINSVVSVGSDLVYMSDRNINLLSLTSTSNALQHQTLPLSRNIRSILNRVNWTAASKVSMAYWDNKLFVSLPLDNATSCNTVAVYNFVTEQWFGEWNFDATLGVAIQGWVVATYLGATRLHCVTEDGRIFVTGEGQNDISGTTVAEIATALTTRAYAMDNENRFTRRMYLDLATNRPNFSVTAYVEGASESTQEVSNQTYSRSDSWIFSDTAYDLTNANNDYNRAFRKDYSTGPASVQCGTGFLPEMRQDFRLPIITRRNGRLQWLKVTNTTGYIKVNSVGFETRAGYRGSLIQVG